ncbi:hypothetical protein [Streptomyces sp. NBC_01022]|uniref:hypothetical protein n=1 Tax=Streptomyces sp. NBC_01022 TaxID=2903723 RepID=UPI002DD85396|nr:hypothetical protein [Streptomyces sp. NBC_01022]WRZ83521.1 hypothetical protein OG316_26355 [Streptomyces sp. NBC_01022]
MLLPEPLHRLFEDLPGFIDRLGVLVRLGAVDQQVPQVDRGRLGAPDVAVLHRHRRTQERDRLVGGGRVADELGPVAQRFGEIVQVQGAVHGRRQAVLHRAAQHRHRFGHPGAVPGAPAAVHERASQVGERHADACPGSVGHGLAQGVDGGVHEEFVAGVAGPAPLEVAQAGEDGAPQLGHCGLQGVQGGQSGAEVVYGFVALPCVAGVAVERPQTVREAQQRHGRGAPRSHHERFPVPSDGLLQRSGVGGETGEVAQGVPEGRAAVGPAVGVLVGGGHGCAQHLDALLPGLGGRAEFGESQQGLAEAHELVRVEEVLRR